MANAMTWLGFPCGPSGFVAGRDAAVADVSEMSTARPIIHLEVPREYLADIGLSLTAS